MFWTTDGGVLGRATLCDRCTLLALNMAAFGYFRRPFDSVPEALATINNKCDEYGIDHLELPGSPVGICGNCGEDNFEMAEVS